MIYLYTEKSQYAKTLLISQYTYVGSILDCITSEQMQLIQKQMDYFINHGKTLPRMIPPKKTSYGSTVKPYVMTKNLVVLAVSTLRSSFLASN